MRPTQKTFTCALLGLSTACGVLVDDPPAGSPIRAEHEVTGCVEFVGPPTQLMPDDPIARHHPTLDLLASGNIIVTWQVGKYPAYIAARTYTPDLEPRTDEVVVFKRDVRATHPQVAAQGEQRAIAWTSELTESLRVAAVDGTGRRTSDPRILVEDDALRPGRYADLSFSPQGDLWVMWFGGNFPAPAWSIATVPRAGAPIVHEFTARETFDLGGPSTLAHGPDGRLWAAWPEQSTRWLGRTSRIYVSPVNPGGGVERRPPVAEDNRRWERTALAFGEDSILVGWTEYPFVAGDWGAWVQALSADGEPRGEPLSLGPADGSMVDLDANGGTAVAVWQEPTEGQTDVVLQVLDAATAAPRCDVVRVTDLTPQGEARANVVLFRDGKGLRGVVVWHTETGLPGVQGIGGRAFRVPEP